MPTEQKSSKAFAACIISAIIAIVPIPALVLYHAVLFTYTDKIVNDGHRTEGALAAVVPLLASLAALVFLTSSWKRARGLARAAGAVLTLTALAHAFRGDLFFLAYERLLLLYFWS